VEVNDSDKHLILINTLILYGISYGRKKFYSAGPGKARFIDIFDDSGLSIDKKKE
jgi:hypothetical protein